MPYTKHRRDRRRSHLQKEFEVEDQVYLSTDGLNLRPKGAPTKLLPRRIRPYESYNF
jgi:hypothetical protein